MSLSETNLDNFPLVRLDELRRVGHYETDFLTGKPGWITELTTGGASISYSTARGGYAQINTGTAAVNDNATLRFSTQIVPANYDLIIMRVEIEGEHNSALAQNRSQFFGTVSGNTINAMRDYDYLNISGVNVATAQKTWTDGPIEQHIVWDVHNDRAWSLVGGLITPLHTNLPIDDTITYNSNFLYFRTNDTTADRICRLFGAELSLYHR